MATSSGIAGGSTTGTSADWNSQNALNTHELLMGFPDWVGYTFGSMFIAIGLMLFFIYPKTAKRANRYRAEQLKEFNKEKKRNVTDYKSTGMYLPAWEKVKMWWPVLLGLTMVILGIAWISGQTLFSA